MSFLRNIYNFCYSFFEMFSFRSKPEYNKINNNDDYEFIVFNDNYIYKK
jgi:hypothetical protein